VSVSDPSQLSTVNSVLVALPEFEASARNAKIDPKQIGELVENTAVRELDLKVVGDDWLGKTLGFTRDSIYGVDGSLSESSRAALRKAGVDGVVRTEILEYVDRIGSAVGGDPASVAFRLSVVRTVDYKTVWQGTYSYRQEALTDNLLKLGQRLGKDGSGTGWTTGMVALERGFDAAFKDFRSRREAQFLSRKGMQ
jgi:hypothetical protein